MYFATTDVEASAARIRTQGGSVVLGPMDVMPEGRLLVAMAPTGAPFGLWQVGRCRGARVVGEPGAMARCEVNTRDAVRAGAFYGEVLGLTARRLDTPGVDYWTLHQGGRDKASCGILQMNDQWPAEVPPHWMVYCAADDLDAALSRVARLGGNVCVPPFDTPYGRISVITDPAGAAFSLIRLPA